MANRSPVFRLERASRRRAEREATRLAAEASTALHACLGGDWQAVHDANLAVVRLVRLVIEHRLDLAA